jgi:hypothetical protein
MQPTIETMSLAKNQMNKHGGMYAQSSGDFFNVDGDYFIGLGG